MDLILNIEKVVINLNDHNKNLAPLNLQNIVDGVNKFSNEEMSKGNEGVHNSALAQNVIKSKIGVTQLQMPSHRH